MIDAEHFADLARAVLWGTEQRQRGSVTGISELPAFLAVHDRGCPSTIVEQCAGNRRYAEY